MWRISIPDARQSRALTESARYAREYPALFKAAAASETREKSRSVTYISPAESQ